MTATCCARAARAGCLVAGSRRPRRWGRSCARSRSGMCASSTRCSAQVSRAGVEGGRRAGRRAAGHRRRQLRRRGLRPAQAGRRLRLHEAVRVSPDPRDARRHARNAAHPAAQGIGEHAEGDAALRRRADRRVTRAGASGVKLLRADSGFWNTKVFERLEKAGWQYSIGVRMIKTVRAAVEAIPEDAWTTIDYPEEGEAQIAEAIYGEPDQLRHPADRPITPAAAPPRWIRAKLSRRRAAGPRPRPRGRAASACGRALLHSPPASRRLR